MSQPLTVEIWSDVQCPWCYIGKRRFETALADSGERVAITYRSFELAPDTPVDYDGTPADYLSDRKGISLRPGDEEEQRQGIYIWEAASAPKR